MAVKAPLKWHGGKFYLAKEIVSMLPKHKHYVEPFFGSGAVFFAKPDGLILDHSEVINDLHKELTCFYVVLRNKSTFQELERRLELTPFSEVEWQSSSNEAHDATTRALRFFIRYRQSRQGIGRSFATLSRNRTRKGMNEQVAAWLGAVEGLRDAHERLRRCVVLNQHANDVIIGQDGVNTFFYLDPPYLPQTRTAPSVYDHEMTLNDHRQLLEILSEVDGKFILSGYRHHLYDSYAVKNMWERVDIIRPNNASNAAHKELRLECLWLNY